MVRTLLFYLSVPVVCVCVSMEKTYVSSAGDDLYFAAAAAAAAHSQPGTCGISRLVSYTRWMPCMLLVL